MTHRKCRWLIHNYTNELVNYIENLPDIDKNIIILSYGKEVCPTTGRPHLQGYIRLKQPLRFTGIQKLLGGDSGLTVWTLPADASDESNIGYTHKGIQTHEEWESQHEKGPNFGLNFVGFLFDRNKIKVFNKYESCMEDILNGADLMEITKKYPELIFKHRRNIMDTIKMIKNENEKNKLIELNKAIVLKQWQQELYNYCLDIPSLTDIKAREITWVYDTVGRNGKSTLADKLVLELGAIKLPNSEIQHISYAYNGEPIIIFDFVRSLEKEVNYEVIEAILDPIVFSAKYASEIKYRASGAITMVFANFLPKLHAMSLDRWRILKLHNSTLTKLTLSEVNNLINPIDINLERTQ